jgi:toxin ParE1/3/4
VTLDFLAPSAEADLVRAASELARDNELAADSFREAALRSIGRIVERPLIGHVRLDLAPEIYRFWRVAGFPYLIVYNAVRRPPLVLRVLHMRRDLPPLLNKLSDFEDFH